MFDRFRLLRKTLPKDNGRIEEYTYDGKDQNLFDIMQPNFFKGIPHPGDIANAAVTINVRHASGYAYLQYNPVNFTTSFVNFNSRDSVNIAFVGTSLVQQCDQFSVNRSSHSTKGWFRWAQIFSSQRFNTPVWFDPTSVPGWEPSGVPGATRNYWGLNMGVSGQTIMQIYDRRERVLNDCKSANVSYIIVDAGTNDMINQTADFIQGFRERICDYFLSGGLNVILLPILTRELSSWPDNSTRQRANEINRRSREYAKTRQDIFIFDWNQYWIDYTNPQGEPVPGYSNDGIHFATFGAMSVGRGFADFMNAILPEPDLVAVSPDDDFDETLNPYGSVTPNKYQTGIGGNTSDPSVTGVIADSWRIQRVNGNSTIVASKESRPLYGDFQVYDISVVDASLFYHRTQTTDISHGGALAGKWVVFECDIETSDYDGWVETSLQLDDAQSPSGRDSWSLLTIDGNPGGHTGKHRTPPLLLPDDSTTLRCRFIFEVDGTPGSPQIKIGSIQCYQVDDPRLSYGIGN